MANQWLRLWHDMPNDPKWRTIAKVSGQPLASVLAIYVHLLVTASQNVTRGHADVTTEDLASALDLEIGQVEAVLSAMQGRVLDGIELSGWSARQPKKEDVSDPESRAMSSAERKRLQRERQKELTVSQAVTSSHAASRNVTTDKDKDKEEDKEKKEPKTKPSAPRAAPIARACAHRENALGILDFLNLHANRDFRPVDANVNLIVARLREGFSPEQCMQVVRNKVREWGHDAERAIYLRPETLFGATKFASYAGQINAPLALAKPGHDSLAEINARNNAEAKRLLGIVDEDELRTING